MDERIRAISVASRCCRWVSLLRTRYSAASSNAAPAMIQPAMKNTSVRS